MRTIPERILSFGLVSIPVGLAPATKPAAWQSDVSFRLLHRECATPIKQKRWCPTHDHEVAQDEIVRGFEVAKGQFVIVEDADPEALERSDDSRSIEITRFVQEDTVDPIYFDRTYFLSPLPDRRGARTCSCWRRCGRRSPCPGAPVRGAREPLPRAGQGRHARAEIFLAEDVHRRPRSPRRRSRKPT